MRSLVGLHNRVLDGLRHPASAAAAATAPAAEGFAACRGSRQCLVVTYRRSGEPVATPVNFGLGRDGRLYFRSEADSGKVRRLRRDPRVRVCPCSIRGKPTGPVAEGRASVLGDGETGEAEAALADNWSAATTVMERGFERLPVDLAYVEVMPA